MSPSNTGSEDRKLDRQQPQGAARLRDPRHHRDGHRPARQRGEEPAARPPADGRRIRAGAQRGDLARRRSTSRRTSSPTASAPTIPIGRGKLLLHTTRDRAHRRRGRAASGCRSCRCPSTSRTARSRSNWRWPAAASKADKRNAMAERDAQRDMQRAMGARPRGAPTSPAPSVSEGDHLQGRRGVSGDHLRRHLCRRRAVRR